MLNINLNLPTLPTQDEKDAMDGANLPSATNVFVTANDITTPNLQEVTDEGNTTTNDIEFGAGAGILLNNGSRLREGTIDAGLGGSKGISQICAVGYELKWEAGRLYVMDGNGLQIRHSLYNFSNIPTASDDSTKGYYVGSLWTLDNGISYICTDSTSGAAIWDLYEAVPQVNADWNATSGVAEILNKPTIPDVTGFVPYTGANNNLDLGTYNLTADHIALNTNPSGAGFVEGATQWNNTIGSSETLLKGGNVTLKNGVDLVARIVNKVIPATTLTKANYQAVKVSGATGQKLSVELAQANLDLNSADTIGIVTETIATNQEGFILTVGQIEDINTTGSLQGETWADGDVLYLSPTTAGRLTNVKPTGATGHIVVMGYVEYAHAIHGKIYVKIMNGWELDELHNVYINGVTNKDLLSYESSTSLWKNKSASTLGIEETTNKSTSVVTDQASSTKYPTVKSLYDWATDLFATISNLALKSDIASPTFTGTLTSPAIVVSSETANTIVSFDASKNIKSLSTATYPTLTELSYVKGVTSAIQTQLNAKSTVGFTLQGGWATTAPADLTTYYANSIVASLVTATANVIAFYIPKNCTLKAAYINVTSSAASNESVTYNAYIGGSATLIATGNSTATNFTVSNTSMSLACTAGQTVFLQIVTPNWATNPTSHRGSYTFYFE